MNDEGPDILDVEPPVEIPETGVWWLYPLLGVIVLLTVLAVWWWRRHRRHEAFVENPKQRALQSLDALKGQTSQMDGYQFGVSASDILRRYITDAHKLKASQQTSHEFLDDLKGRDLFNERDHSFLAQFLESCDFLKFAPAGKAEEPNQELLEQTTLFIRQDVS